MTTDLLTLPEVQKVLRVGYLTLNKYIKDGKIPVVCISRTKRFIRKEDLDKFIQEHTGVYKK